jgi:hypothetical protein
MLFNEQKEKLKDLVTDRSNGYDIYQDFVINMTYVYTGYQNSYLSHYRLNVYLNTESFWDSVKQNLEAYQKYARYLYDFRLYLKNGTTKPNLTL